MFLFLGQAGLKANELNPDFQYERAKSLDILIHRYVENEQFSGAILVVDGDQLILAKGFGFANLEWEIPNTEHTRFRIASMTKQFTAIVTFKFWEMGRLDLDDSISKYLAYYPKDPGENITIRQLLCHSAGLPNFVDGGRNDADLSREDFVVKYCAGPLRFKPGSHYSYSNAGYFLLGIVLEEISGRSMESLLQEFIFRPAQMTQSGVDDGFKVIPCRASSYEKGLSGYVNADRRSSVNLLKRVFTAGYCYSSIEDMLKWHRALAGNLLLGSKAKREMLRPLIPLNPPGEAQKRNPLLFDLLGEAYTGYMGDVFVKKNHRNGLDRHCYQHNGGIDMYRSHNYHIPSLGRYLTVLGNNGSEKGDEMIWQMMNILDGKEAVMPKKSVISPMRKAYIKDGIKGMVAEFQRCRHDSEYQIKENELNALGYSIMREGLIDEAKAVFFLNTQAFPKSANAWDSYAESLLKSGDRSGAIRHYRRALQLNPQSRSASEALKNLEKG